jgi:hypothetical protein
VDEAYQLLLNSFRLWVASRKTSHPERLVGTDTLGVSTVDDPASPWHDFDPMPPIIIAQLECIVYTTLLQPLRADILKKLHALAMANKREH